MFLAHMGVSCLDSAQMGSTMADMDSTRYAEAVAEHVAAAIKKSGKPVLLISSETGIPRTTLQRRLTSPETSPFTVMELGRISTSTGVPVSRLTEMKTKKSPQVAAAGDETGKE